tara:strand:- start:13875 stop:14768 length:894 start_codon:yes stop_codon:yes gene_type:complete
MTSQIFWLPAYPKSGNTLLRSVLVSLFFTNDGIFSLDKIYKIGQFEETRLLQKNKHIFGKLFNKINQIEILYKFILELQTKDSLNIKDTDIIFLKTHSGLFKVLDYPFTRLDKTRGFIYMIRDPRDICISLSKHIGKSIDETIEFMINENQGLNWNETDGKPFFSNKKRPSSYLSSWNRHVISWTENNWKIPQLIIKYEDLVYNKKNILINIINFFENNYNIKFNYKELKINNILISTDFKVMSKEEKVRGFKEAIGKSEFFSVGKKSQWKKILKTNQIRKINNKFKFVMEKFNYEI